MATRKNRLKVHEPVLAGEVLKALGIDETAPLNNQARYIDATVATAGYSIEIIRRGGRVLGIDADEKILEIAKKRLEKTCSALNRPVQGCFKLVHGNFRKIDEIAKKASFAQVDGIIFDLGVSSLHLESVSRGFSFRYPGAALDMRFDKVSQKVTASDLLNSLPRTQLQELFAVVMSQGTSKKLADKVAASRTSRLIKSVGDFLEVVERTVPRKGKLHPATKPFLALRIAVNSELENLKEALPKAFSLLEPGGRLVVISFHSGEDGFVKKFFRKTESEDLAHLVAKKPILPSFSEIEDNPRARSAKMRVLEKHAKENQKFIKFK